MQLNNLQSDRCQQGSALIEVLIAVVLFAIGALGLLALNASMVTRGKSSVDQTIAAALASEFLSAARADGERQLALGSPFVLNATMVSELTTQVQETLPTGTVNVTANTFTVQPGVLANVVNLTIGWQGPNDPDARVYRSSTAFHP
ncbi:MAG: prepilin-type N-terminal cleavage/methylation domain-containing protein [Burkholderiaceae bacterium]